MLTRKTSYLISAVILYFLTSVNPVFAVSAAVKSHEDYNLTLDKLRMIRVIVDNFGNEEQKTKYEEIKSLFNRASEEYYAQNFDSSQQKFINLKERMAELLDIIAQFYIKRGQEILDSTSKSSFDIILKYNKNSGLQKYFTKPYNPVEDIKPYKEDEYHFFHDRETIERYLNHGYRKLQEAKNIYNDPDLLIFKAKKRKTSKNLNYIIDHYSKVVDDCRLAKQYGIEIHKLIKSHLIGDILRKYNLTDSALDPVFDDRIPEDYKVDANDNIKLIHSIEKEKLTVRESRIRK
jgi:hypothetical protein